MTSSRAVPGPSPRWLVEAGLAGRPSFAIAPLLACGGTAVIAVLRITGHPAGPFAASLVEGVLPLGAALAVARLIGTDRGSVRAGDWDLGRPRERRQFQGRLGYLPRDLGLYPELSGRRFLDYAGTLKGMSSPRRRNRRVAEVLHLTGLDAAADRPAGGYSGGMRRRLGLAQALLNDPAVLLLDEPTAGLDPQEQTRIRMLLVSLAGQRTVVLATRDAADVSSTCERCAVLAGGRVIFQGDAAGLARAAGGLVWSVQTDRPLNAAQAAAVVSAIRLPDRPCTG